MASVTTYILISGIEHVEKVKNYGVLEDLEVEYEETVREETDKPAGTIRYSVEQPLEDRVDLTPPSQQLSSSFPEGTVVICEIVNRFRQIERVETAVFRDGDQVGDIEHGYVYNVGRDG